MQIEVITHTPKNSLKGNRITAQRWTRYLRQLGHKVTISQNFRKNNCDLMIALHASHTFPAIEEFHKNCPGKPIVVLLTGTDIHKDIHTNPNVRKSLEYADRLILLQPLGIRELPVEFHRKVRVIVQSAEKLNGNIQKRKRTFDVSVIGHLRKVKDPFITAYAVRNLPDESQIRLLHVGDVLEPEMRSIALQEMANNSRYFWLGKKPRWQTLIILARSRVVVLSSLMEGGPSVLSEAVVAGVPILASRISATLGLLGEDYPGFFEVGDTSALSKLLYKTETDPQFMAALKQKINLLADKFDPSVEKLSLKKLLKEWNSENQN